MLIRFRPVLIRGACAALSVLGSGAAAQGAGGTPGVVSCNNQARTMVVDAGWHNVLNGPCTSITITIGVPPLQTSFQTPASCPMGGAYYDGSIYTCGPSSLGNHCIAQGYKVKVVTYDTGGQSNCPPLPTTTHFADWASAVGLIEAWLKCPSMPVSNTSYDWSASVRKCPGMQGATGPVSGTHVSTDADDWTYWEGDPAPLLSPPGLDPFQPFGPGPAIDPGDVESHVRTVREAHAVLTGASIRADFTIEWPAKGMQRHESVAGSLGSDGRFRLDSTCLARAPSGDYEPLTDEMSFDGATFFFGTADAPVYNAFSASSSRRLLMLDAMAPHAWRLHQWLGDPFGLPALPASSYLVETFGSAPSAWVRITRQHSANAADLATTEVDVDLSGGTWHPMSSSLRRPDGTLVLRREFSNYEEIAPGNWRPTVIVERRMDQAGVTPWEVATLRISHMAPLTQAQVEAIPRAQSSLNAWYVRQ